MEEKIYCIYKHTSPSGKAYIGQSCRYKERCNRHKNSKEDIPFPRAIRKYGWDSFKHEILLSNLTLDQANKYEEFYISEHDTMTPNGYNAQTGGKNCKVSDETRMKHSKAHKGVPKTQEHKDKIGLAHKGRKLSPERIQKLIEINTGRKHTAEQIDKIAAARIGTHLSEDTKSKISKSNKGKPKSKSHVENMVNSKAELKFKSEYVLYKENIDLLSNQQVIGAAQLSKLLGVDRMTIKNRIYDNLFPNVTRGLKGSKPWIIPIQDVHNYYSEGIIKYGE